MALGSDAVSRFALLLPMDRSVSQLSSARSDVRGWLKLVSQLPPELPRCARNCGIEADVRAEPKAALIVRPVQHILHVEPEGSLRTHDVVPVVAKIQQCVAWQYRTGRDARDKA